MEVNMREQIKTISLDHPVMPVDLVMADGEVTIVTGKSGSQSQMLLDDVAVILTAALKAGVTADQLKADFGAVDPRDAPVTRMILEALVQDTAEGGHHARA